MNTLLRITLLLLFNVCYVEGRDMMIIAHRGASSEEPENTIRAFKKAIALGADMIEFDVHECASGEIVIIHDDTLDRTTNGYGAVGKTTLAGLERLDAGKGEPIPLLQKVLELFKGKIKLNIELKGKHTGEPVADLLHEYIYHYGWSIRDILVTSFDHSELLKLHKIMPSVQLGALFDLDEKITFNPIFKVIVIAHENITSQLVREAHEARVKVFVYTVNDEEDIKYCIQCGVDGIISDSPTVVKSLVSKEIR